MEVYIKEKNAGKTGVASHVNTLRLFLKNKLLFILKQYIKHIDIIYSIINTFESNWYFVLNNISGSILFFSFYKMPVEITYVEKSGSSSTMPF